MRRWVGVPYESFAVDGRAGCWGLVRAWMREERGIDLPAYVDAGEREHEERRWERVPAGEELEGDVVELRVPGSPLHVGVVVGRGRMLHVLEGGTSRIERYDRPPWCGLVRAFWRWRG